MSHAVLLIGMWTAFGCKKPLEEPVPLGAPEAVPTHEDPAPVDGCAVQVPCEVAPGLTVTVTAVNDSRCPEGAACMWAGNAEVQVQVGDASLTLHSSTAVGPATQALPDGRTLVLEDVLPHPSVEGPAEDVYVKLGIQ